MLLLTREDEIRAEAKAEGRAEAFEEGRVEGREEGRAEGREEGRVEGIAIGKEQARRTYFDNLLAYGMSYSDAAKILGL